MVISWGFEGAQVKVNTAHIPTGDNEGDFTLDALQGHIEIYWELFELAYGRHLYHWLMRPL